MTSGAPVALLGAGLLTAGPASAHGIGGDAADASVAEFVNIGAEHMLLGWDHILFVAGVLLLAGTPRRGARIITAFVAGHSLTLITATLAGWQVDPVLVDVVIVLSVVVVGAWGMIGRPQRWDVFTAIVFAFGLVHGLGLATRFQALGVPEDGMLWRLITFNIGIELGQLMVILAVFTLATVVSMMLKGRYLTGLSKAAFFAMFGGGAILASLMAYWGFLEDDSQGLDVALPPGSQCVVAERSEPFPAAGGGHTEQTFFAPGEEVPMADFGHSLADGYVIVLYPDSAPETDVEALQEFVTSGDPNGVLAGPRASTGARDTDVVAVTDEQQMTCHDVHVGALRQFSRSWLESIGALS